MHDRIDASCGEDTSAGNFLGKLYYETKVLDLLKPGTERSGYPNDGGRHSLYLMAPREDIEAFLDLISADFGRRKGCKEFVEHVRSRLN